MRRIFFRLLAVFRSDRAERELSREINAHLQLLEDQYVARGMALEEARCAARRAFGGVEQVKEHQRDARTFRWLAGWPMDLKLAGRMLIKYPGLTIVGGFAMAFAIWVGLIVFQVFGLAAHPTLPLPQGDRLVQLRLMDLEVNDEEDQILSDFLDWRESLRTVTDVGAWRDSTRNLVVSGDAHPVNIAEMSVAGFRVSDGEPLLGRGLVEADEQPAAPPVAVIGHEVWRTRLGSDPDVLGRDVQLGSEHVTVVGVMREGFEFPIRHDVWLPLKTAGLDQQPRSGPAMAVFALLAPGETIQTAQAELTAAGRRAAAEYPATHQHLEPRVRAYPLMMVPDGPPERVMMYSVYVVIALLLALICGNVGLLLFARAASRESDLVIRTVLGASRGRIVAQMFAEALVLGGVAAIAGIAAADYALGTWGVMFLETNLGRLPFWFDLSLSARGLAVAIVLTVAGAAVAGIMPAMKVTRRMGHRLKETAAGSGGLQFGGVWTVVIVAQVAATVMFPALAYWEQSLASTYKEFESGFASEQYLAVQIERDDAAAGTPNDAAALERKARLSASLEELRRRVAAQPGVRAVTFTERAPATNRPPKRIEMGYDVSTAASAKPDAGASTTTDADPFRQAAVAAVDASYFEALDAAILAGRAFTAADTAPGARVAIVDQGFVDQILKGRNAVGQQVRFRYAGPPERPWAPRNPDDGPRQGEWYEVIGVVPDLGAQSPSLPWRAAGFYLPITPDRFDQVHMMVRVRGGDPMTVAPQLREIAAAVDPSLRFVTVQRANEVNSDEAWVMGMWVRITAVLSTVAVVLSLAGIYAVLSFTVARRTREIGVRVALGASRRRVVAAIFRRPLFQVTGGIVVGTAIVLASAILLKYTDLQGSRTPLTLLDMAMIAGYGIVMLGVSMLACLVPARRALNIEPTIALRTE
jgi:putative ABC transport system permease protein